MKDIERAKQFLEKVGPVPFDEDNSLLLDDDDNFICFDREIPDPTFPSYFEAIAILEKWIKDQLRDGGKNVVLMLECVDKQVECVVMELSSGRRLVVDDEGLRGQSDLEALVKSYYEFKEAE